MGTLKDSIKKLQIMEMLFLSTTLLSCLFGIYLVFFGKLETLVSLVLAFATIGIILFGLIRYGHKQDWLKNEIFYFVIAIILAFHSPIFFYASSKVTYSMILKDDDLIKGDTFFLGWAFPKGQLSLYLDLNDNFGPHTSLGLFINNILQIFYFLYYTIPYIFLYFFSLAKCVSNTINRKKQKGIKRQNHDGDLDILFFLFSIYNITYFFVFFINTLCPASSPRLHLKYDYTHPLKLTGPAHLINEVCQINESANSFPSGHVAETFCFFFGLREIKYKKSAMITLISSIMIALATLFLRYHYFVNVLCGFLISLLAYLISRFVYRKAKFERSIEGVTYPSEVEMV